MYAEWSIRMSIGGCESPRLSLHNYLPSKGHDAFGRDGPTHSGQFLILCHGGATCLSLSLKADGRHKEQHVSRRHNLPQNITKRTGRHQVKN